MKSTLKINNKFRLLTRQFGNVHVVWFSASRQFLMLEEPAFFVLQQLQKGEKTDNIKMSVHSKLKLAKADANLFVNEITGIFKSLNKKTPGISKKSEANNLLPSPNPEAVCSYQSGKIKFKIAYQNQWLRHLIHPSFLHLETPGSCEETKTISCFQSGNLLVVSYDGNVIEAFSATDAEYYKGAVSQLIYSILYKKPFSGWMCTLHASGVFANNKAIIFSAAAGSGKSTVSAILKANGFGFISDDFVAATPDGKVYPFPASMTVKEGAMKVLSGYYPELPDKTAEKAATGKMVRYLPVHNYDEKFVSGINVAAFIFVKYEANCGFNLSETNKKEALQLLLQETWVNPKSKFVESFFAWVERTPFFTMTYSDNEKMIATVKKLLES